MKTVFKLLSLLLFVTLLSSCLKRTWDSSVADIYGNDYLIINDVATARAELTSAGLPTYNKEKGRITVSYNYSLHAVLDNDLAQLEQKYDWASVNLPEDRKYKKEVFQKWIEPRVRPIKNDYNAYRSKIKQLGNSTYYFIYARETPRITADKTLFGREPGTPLEDLFYVYATESVVKAGEEGFKLVELGGEAMAYAEGKRVDKIFTPGTLWMPSATLASRSFPEELANQEKVNLTITFPVTVEHFWKYALQLPQNESAEEEFVDMDLSMTVSLQ